MRRVLGMGLGHRDGSLGQGDKLDYVLAKGFVNEFPDLESVKLMKLFLHCFYPCEKSETILLTIILGLSVVVMVDVCIKSESPKLEFAQILDIPCEGACVFTDKWSLDELAYGVPTDGPYQPNPPSPDDIISYIRIDREGQVRRISHEQEINVHYHQSPELSNESYVLYDRVMNPLTAQQERKTRKDRGMRRGRHSTSSSSAFDQLSSSHVNNDDDGNGEGTSHASTPSPIRFVNSLTNDVHHVFQNPPNIYPHMEPFYTRQTEIINCQVQIQYEYRGGLMLNRKGLRNLLKNMKK
ncbi:hypothetical protein Tco_0004749 [Tanacetum coccineum]